MKKKRNAKKVFDMMLNVINSLIKLGKVIIELLELFS